jgi:hypothetical protein
MRLVGESETGTNVQAPNWLNKLKVRLKYIPQLEAGPHTPLRIVSLTTLLATFISHLAFLPNRMRKLKVTVLGAAGEEPN